MFGVIKAVAMMPCKCMFILFLFLVARSLQTNYTKIIENAEYGYCDGSQELFIIEYLDIYPFSMSICQCKTIYISAVADLLVPIPVGATVSVKIVKEGLLQLPIPCLELDECGLVGSCRYDAEDFLSKYAGYLCPDAPCLPIQPGHYGDVGETTVLTFPEYPEILCDMFYPGYWLIELSIDEPNGSEITCINIRVEMSEECTSGPGPDQTTNTTKTTSN